ncbi:Modification methylase HaeIII [Paraburkholderia nemoris]|uniref:DNA cytosine methyltransferase n=1 Tax=Paraburkholderia nemoris TaxID=2793076 RepID=UPI00190B747A|nr:DNA cytosine methyltransferase [Paraburkholderia nemoris]MBK3743143.1 DNA cytosine methyltransferase [Paraburkholderia aspalathi]CAE6768496.1 Modification methylase HaeIII [Paraburkholderia nemoris]
MTKYSALDLFSGAGGFSLGAQMAGIDVVGSIELDRFASETYEANFPNVLHRQKSIADCSSSWLKRHFSGVDLVIGGPPCQGFSVAGPAQYGIKDERNGLILEMARVIGTIKPKFAVLENVRGILAGRLSRGDSALAAYIESLKSLGYSSTIFDLNAADFGTPQLRRRIFVVSSTDEALLPSYIPTDFGEGKQSWVRSIDALSDLPSLGPGEGNDELIVYPKAPESLYQKKIRRGSRGVVNHLAMKHTPRIVARLAEIAVGGSMRDVAPEHGQRMRNTGEIDAGQRYKMNCTRINPEMPSLALPANFQTIHVHPYENRMLTAREGARIQGFPDSFVFKGPRTLMSKKLLIREGRENEIGLSQYNQIGNAVPPLLARGLLRAL